MFDKPIKLEGCRLRGLVESDAESIAELADNPEVARRMRNLFPSPYRVEDARWFIDHCARGDSVETHLAIDVAGRAAGVVGLIPGEAGEVHARTAEIGYWIGEPFWGRGIATQVVSALCRLAFENSDLLRIFATVFEGNTASCRVLEKAGFTREGVMRAHVEKGGEILDAHLFAKINPCLHEASPLT